jgi:phage I-like protein
MTYTALSIHKKLIEQEGFDGKSDEYYKELDKRIKKEFPHKFEDKDKSSRVVQTVASATRSTKSGRRTVRLTPSQVAIAKKLGVPLDEYAKHVKEA